jgi:hypothetical protein
MGNNMIINKVYYPGSDVPLMPCQLAAEAGPHMRASDYPARITGKHCDCKDGGEFVLLPRVHPDVVAGGKRYMTCRKCGCASHL